MRHCMLFGFDAPKMLYQPHTHMYVCTELTEL